MAQVDIDAIIALQQRLNDLGGSVTEEVSQEMVASALVIVRNAQRAAPVNFGTLRNGISFIQNAALDVSITANANYSAYMEFGTGGLVNVPLGFEEYANAARGEGIRVVNIRPRPYIVPAILTEKPLLTNRIETIIRDALTP